MDLKNLFSNFYRGRKEVNMTETIPEPKDKPQESVEKTPSARKVPVIKADTTIPTVKPTGHEHQWDLILKNYAAPKPEFLNLENLDRETSEKILFGVTILLWKCVLCEQTRKEEVIGTDENQLDEMLGKVILYGPQYVQKDGVTFVLAKWQPAAPTTPNVLPLR